MRDALVPIVLVLVLGTTPLRIQSLGRGSRGCGAAAGGNSQSTSQSAADSFGTFSPGSLPYGDACSISEFSSAPTRIAKLETENQSISTMTPPMAP